MKKNIPAAKPKSSKQEVKLSKMEEPATIYRKTVRVIPSLKDFTYSEFKKIADKAPFTQPEWASILHVSERTMQRYSKSNSSFAPINAERALQVDKILHEAKIAFGDIDAFYNWLKGNPYMAGGNLSMESLTTAAGLERLLTQLLRIQHGLFA